MSVQDGWANDPIRAAGGRRHYNSVRRCRAELRKIALLRIVTEEGWSLIARGTQARLARRLGVSDATISRDMRGILATRPEARSCPACGARPVDEDGEDAVDLAEEWLEEALSRLGYYLDHRSG